MWLEGELGGPLGHWEGMHSRNFQRRTQGVGSRQSWCAKTQQRLWRLRTDSGWTERPEDRRTRSAVAIVWLRPLGTPNFKIIRQVKSPFTMLPSNPAPVCVWGGVTGEHPTVESLGDVVHFLHSWMSMEANIFSKFGFLFYAQQVSVPFKGQMSLPHRCVTL